MELTGFDRLRGIMPAATALAASPRRELVLGPCAIEDAEQMATCARAAAAAGADYLRGGAIKLRTRLGSFEGYGPTAWRLLRDVAGDHGLKTISEVTRADDVENACEYLDALQVGARSMWNFDLLNACAQSGKTVVLKRGLGASTSEWLAASERLSTGSSTVILCERGDRASDRGPRNAIDLSTLIFLVNECPLPVWLDVSHSAGDPRVAMQLLRVCAGLGVAGAMAEIHPDPPAARCDAEQAIPVAWIDAAFAEQWARGAQRAMGMDPVDGGRAPSYAPAA